MALAWLAHLRFKAELSFVLATLFAWAIALPEYALNIAALRKGIRHYTGGQMAAFRLCAGVVFIAVVARLVLGEPLTWRKLAGFGVMVVAMALVGTARRDPFPSIYPKEGEQ